MDFRTWLRIYHHMEIEDYLKLSFDEKLFIEHEYYNEGY